MYFYFTKIVLIICVSLVMSGCAAEDTEEVVSAFPDGSPETVVRYAGKKSDNNTTRFTTLNAVGDTMMSVNMKDNIFHGRAQLCESSLVLKGSKSVDICSGKRIICYFNNGYITSAQIVENGTVIYEFQLSDAGEVSTLRYTPGTGIGSERNFVAKDPSTYMPQYAMKMGLFIDVMSKPRQTTLGIMLDFVQVVATEVR